MSKEKESAVLTIDDKWSVRYNPEENDRPIWLLRHGVVHSDWNYDNAVTAMFYALLAHKQRELEGF